MCFMIWVMKTLFIQSRSLYSIFLLYVMLRMLKSLSYLLQMPFSFCSSFSLGDQKFENDHLASNASDPEQVLFVYPPFFDISIVY